MKLSDIAENQHLVREPSLPGHVMLKDGFYMERGSTHERGSKWFVHRLMDEDDQPYAIIHVNPGHGSWTYVPLREAQSPELRQHPLSVDFFNMDKLKDFAIECLVHEGWLPQPT